MLEKYKDGQPIVFNILNNALNNKKISHAYLFDTNGNSIAHDMAMEFVKQIICMDDSANYENISKRIDDGNYLDVKVIEPDGLWIKKEQVLELEKEFNKKALEGSKKIYIIKSAEMMNSSTANAILKFLEEPVDDIIAILLVDNLSKVLPTIVSRCQLIRFTRNKYQNSLIENFDNLFLSCKLANKQKEEFIDNVICYLKELESSKFNMIIYNKKFWHEKFKNRDDCIMAMELIINFYYDVIKYKTLGRIDFFNDKELDVIYVSDLNDINNIIRKIEIVCNVKNYFVNNLNINLIMDRFVIEMCGE